MDNQLYLQVFAIENDFCAIPLVQETIRLPFSSNLTNFWFRGYLGYTAYNIDLTSQTWMSYNVSAILTRLAPRAPVSRLPLDA